MKQVWPYVFVGVGGAIGSIARFWMTTAVDRAPTQSFPWGTLAVNVLGSFAIGILASFAVAEGRTALTPSMRQFLMAGVCGGFTTFSAFSLQTLELLQHRHWLAASGNIALSLILCLVAVAIGFGLGSMLNARAA